MRKYNRPPSKDLFEEEGDVIDTERQLLAAWWPLHDRVSSLAMFQVAVNLKEHKSVSLCDVSIMLGRHTPSHKVSASS